MEAFLIAAIAVTAVAVFTVSYVLKPTPGSNEDDKEKVAATGHEELDSSLTTRELKLARIEELEGKIEMLNKKARGVRREISRIEHYCEMYEDSSSDYDYDEYRIQSTNRIADMGHREDELEWEYDRLISEINRYVKEKEEITTNLTNL